MLKETPASKMMARKEEMTIELMQKMLDNLTDYSPKKQIRIIMDRKELFDALPIIDTLLKNDMVNGKTNVEVYDLYLLGCKGLGIPPAIKENFGKYLCKYFDFTLKNKRFGKDVIRVYQKELENNSDIFHVIDTEVWEGAIEQDKILFCKKYAAVESDILTSDDYKLMLQFLLKQACY